jgi:predicted acyl esterase
MARRTEDLLHQYLGQWQINETVAGGWYPAQVSSSDSMATTIDGIEILFKEANRDFTKRWHQFGPSKEVLPKGWQKAEGRRALEEDLIFERDIRISLRDGTTIWADVFRPVVSDNKLIPAILAWSPYGKQGNGAYFFNDLGRIVR